MKEKIVDSVLLATKDVVEAVGSKSSAIAARDTAITVLIIVLAAVTFFAVRWGMKVYNAKKNGVDMSKF